MLRRLATRFEAALTAFERALIVVLMAIMAASVFLDAMHRLFAADEGRLERLLSALLPAAAQGRVRAVVAPAVLILVTFALAYGGVRTRTGTSGSRRRAAAVAAAITFGLAGAAQLLVRGLPNGLVWSQQMSLALLLIVALTGASLGAREHTHVTFELAGALWPRRLRRPAELAARLCAAGFTLFLALLAALHAREHYLEWSGSGGAAGLFEAFPVPRWTIFGFLPVPLAALALRFAVYGVRAPETAEAQP
jgi:TRAP-type C4-dicarboxylate transport system permease small subunit